MKTLLLLRHAKSSKDDPTLRDFDRPLNERGIADSQLMGKLFREQKIRPDLVLSSPARRARQTAESVVKSAGMEVELRFEERIYEASARRLLGVVTEIEDSRSLAVLVGHNPGFEELFELLVAEARNLPTASLSCIDLSVEKWDEARARVGRLKWLVTPKELKRQS